MIVAQGGEALANQVNVAKEANKDNTPEKGDFMNQILAGRQSPSQEREPSVKQEQEQTENFSAELAEPAPQSQIPAQQEFLFDLEEVNVPQEKTVAEVLVADRKPVFEDAVLSSAVAQQTKVVSGRLQQGQFIEQRWYAQGKLSYDVKASEAGSKGISATTNGLGAETEITSSTTRASASVQAQVSGELSQGQQAAISQAEAKTQTRRMLSSSSTSSAHSLASVPEYLKKKLTFVEKDQQLEIFVRDYELSDAEKIQLADSLVKHFQNLGTSINQVYINGQRFSR